MKEKKVRKALEAHGVKLAGYAGRMSRLVDEMLADGCTVGDAIAVLEEEKLYRYARAHIEAREEAIADIAGLLGGGAL